ncbi:MAG: hypothetical protein ACFFDK_15205 [Promethearchaeota archaeon]
MNGRVNFLSENNGKTINFRIVGASPGQAIRAIAIENSKASFEDIKEDIINELELNQILDYKFIINGKVIPNSMKIAELRLKPDDVIMVIGEQAGSAPVFKKQRVEKLIKEGLTKEELFKLFDGDEELIKRSFQTHYGVNTFEAAQAKILNRPILDSKELAEYNKALNLAEEKGLILISDEFEFKQALKKLKNGVPKRYAILEWKHGAKKNGDPCGHVWENTRHNIERNIGACPICDSRLVNQKITNAIAKYVFDYLGYIEGNYKTEHSLIKIFPELEGRIHHAVHVDGYFELNIKDKNGNYIKLAIEFQGQQHDPKEEIGFEAYKAVSRQFNLEAGSTEYELLYKKWQELLRRDNFKRNMFKDKNIEGYYLIEVPYSKEPHERQNYIIAEFNKFKELTGITIETKDVPYKNWRKL